MKTGYVYHSLPDRTPPQHIPTLFITDIPQDVSADQLRGVLLTRYAFGESDQQWAGYIVDIGLQEAPAEIQQGWQSGRVETISYADLTKEQSA